MGILFNSNPQRNCPEGTRPYISARGDFSGKVATHFEDLARAQTLAVTHLEGFEDLGTSKLPLAILWPTGFVV